MVRRGLTACILMVICGLHVSMAADNLDYRSFLNLMDSGVNQTLTNMQNSMTNLRKEAASYTASITRQILATRISLDNDMRDMVNMANALGADTGDCRQIAWNEVQDAINSSVVTMKMCWNLTKLALKPGNDTLYKDTQEAMNISDSASRNMSDCHYDNACKFSVLAKISQQTGTFNLKMYNDAAQFNTDVAAAQFNLNTCAQEQTKDATTRVRAAYERTKDCIQTNMNNIFADDVFRMNEEQNFNFTILPEPIAVTLGPVDFD